MGTDNVNVLAFTSVEGGDWLRWPLPMAQPQDAHLALRNRECVYMGFDILYEHTLSATQQQTLLYDNGLRSVVVGHIELRVHSLLYDNGLRWDCVNGFTGPIRPMLEAIDIVSTKCEAE